MVSLPPEQVLYPSAWVDQLPQTWPSAHWGQASCFSKLNVVLNNGSGSVWERNLASLHFGVSFHHEPY